MLFQVEGWSPETQELLIVNYIKRDTVPLKKKNGHVSTGTMNSHYLVFAEKVGLEADGTVQANCFVVSSFCAQENTFMTLGF